MAKTVIVSTIELATFLGFTKQGLYKRGELPPADFISVGGNHHRLYVGVSGSFGESLGLRLQL